MKKKSFQLGFTLVELMVAVTIIGILSVIGVSTYSNAQKSARDAARKIDIDAIAGAYEDNYNIVAGTYNTLSDSQFTKGTKPKDPSTGNDYTIVDGPNPSTGYTNTCSSRCFKVCTALETNPTGSYCRTNQQGAPSTVAYTPPSGGIAPPGAPPTPNPVFNGLASYWKMDEASGTNVADSFNAHTGTAIGTTVVAGKIGNARSFNGSGDYINLANPSTNFPAGLSPRSVCLWGFNLSTLNTGKGALYYGSQINGGAMFINNLGSTLTLNVGGYNAGDIQIPNFWTVSTWKHVCITYDGVQPRLYGNGVLLNTPSNFSWSTVLSGAAHIGRSPWGYWQGYIDEVGVWSRALSGPPAVGSNCTTHPSNEICTLYNGGNGLTY